MSEHDEQKPVRHSSRPFGSPGARQPYQDGQAWRDEAPSYPTQSFPTQGYPTQGYPTQGYPTQGYPTQGYQAPASYEAPNYQAPDYGPPDATDTFAYPYAGYSPTPTYTGTPTYPGGWEGGWQAPPQPPQPPQRPQPPPPPYGSWGPAPGPAWSPQPPGPPPRNSPLTIILVAILIAAVVGLAIGGQLVRHNNTARGRVPTFVPTLPPGSQTPSGSAIAPSQAAAIAANVDPSIVDINTKLGYQRAAAAGTGMVLTSDGQVLTNNHVIAGSTSITAMVVGGKSYTAHLVGTDPTEDVALIKLDNASGLIPIKTGDPAKVAVGDAIVAVGNAGGVGGTPSVVTGSVEALDQSVTASDMGGANAETLSGLIEINAPLQPGDSGGPLINLNSQVVGMNTAASATSRVESQSSVGFAIPITKAISIAHEIAAGHASATIQIGLPGFVGVSVAPTTTANGAAVSGVISGGPADKAGLTAGSVITSVNGQTVDSGKTLTAILQQRHPGDKVTLGWSDSAGKKHTATITLTTGPAA